jgi:hypothetical protein
MLVPGIDRRSEFSTSVMTVPTRGNPGLLKLLHDRHA